MIVILYRCMDKISNILALPGRNHFCCLKINMKQNTLTGYLNIKKIKTLTKQIKTTSVSCSFKGNKYVKQKKRPCLVGYFMLYTSDDSN